MSLDDWREWADRFNQAGETARKAGIWLGLHNEDKGFQPIDGQIPYDVFLDRTDTAVTRHQLDTGNLAAAGKDPVEYVRRYGQRYWSFHLKDLARSQTGSNVPGEGLIKFRELLSLIPDIDQKHFVVEFDAEGTALAAAGRATDTFALSSFDSLSAGRLVDTFLTLFLTLLLILILLICTC